MLSVESALIQIAAGILDAHVSGSFSRKRERKWLIKNATMLLEISEKVNMLIPPIALKRLHEALSDFERPDASQLALKIQREIRALENIK